MGSEHAAKSPWPDGAVVQRVSVLGTEAASGREIVHSVILKLRRPGESGWLVLSGLPGATPMAVVSERPHASPFTDVEGPQRKLRVEIEGARIVGVSPHALLLARGDLRIVVGLQGGGPKAVRAIFVRPATRIEIDEGLHAPEGFVVPFVEAPREGEDGDGTGDAGPLALVERARTDRERVVLASALDAAITRVERRARAIRGDLTKMDALELRAQRATMFVAEASRAPRGTRELTTVDWTGGSAETVTFPVDPSTSARAQIDALFKRARRMKEGRKFATSRLASCDATVDALRNLKARLVDADAATLQTLLSDARAVAPKDVKLDRGSRGPSRSGDRLASSRDKSAGGSTRRHFRTYEGHGGNPIFVGKGGADNDILTMKVARPSDLFVHVKERSGAHVIVPLTKGASCPAEVLVDAALLAVHFSDMRGESVVDVQYAPRKYVRKPKGGPPGLVVVDREKVLVLRNDPSRLATLLAAATHEDGEAGETRDEGRRGVPPRLV
ncbi:MAG: NFACT RNA binding domain-containing protein [Polyangiaceae bacterium]